jgi:hypothetical protein
VHEQWVDVRSERHVHVYRLTACRIYSPR